MKTRLYLFLILGMLVLSFSAFAVVIPDPYEKSPTIKEKHPPINVTYEQVLLNQQEYFNIAKADSIDGYERYMGVSFSGCTSIDIIGSKNNISSIELVVAHCNKKQFMEDIITSCLIVYNTDPEYWIEHIEIMDGMLNNLHQTNKVQVHVFGNKKVTMEFFKDLGIITIIVKHK